MCGTVWKKESTQNTSRGLNEREDGEFYVKDTWPLQCKLGSAWELNPSKERMRSQKIGVFGF